jgi:MFS transporter, DHA2 family, methylenomycin A resistance protein
VHPASGDEHVEQRRPERAAEVRTLLAPVDAVPEQRPPSRPVESHAKRGQPLPAGLGQLIALSPARAENGVGRAARLRLHANDGGREQGIAERDAEAPGEVVVAGAGPADGFGVRGLAQRADRPGRGQPGQGLDRLGHLRTGQAEVTVSAGALDPDQPAVKQSAQVRGQRRGSDLRLGSQRGGGERPAIGQGDEYRRPDGLANESGHGGDVGISTHARDTTSATIRASPKYPATRLSGMALIAICIGYFMVILDTTVVNVALPSLARGLGTSTTGLQWIVDSYSLVFAALLLSAGALADRRGAKTVFGAGIGLFTAASAAAGFATSAGALVAARCVQGAGAALAVPASLALLQAAYPGQRARRRAFGIWGGIAGVAAGAGPVVGGALVSAAGWRSVFFVNVPIGVLGLIMAARAVPAVARRPHGADPAGQVAACACLAGITVALVEAGAVGWSSPLVIAGFCLCMAAGVVFVVIEHATVRPMLPMAMFRSGQLAAATAVGLLINLGFYGELFVMTLYLQQVLGMSPVLAGIALLPQMAMAVVGSTASGIVMARTGPRAPMLAGLLTGAAGLFGLIAAGPHGPYLVLVVPFVATGLGMSFTMPAATAAAMEAAPAERAGLASGTLNAARQVGGVIGVALLGTLVADHGRFIAGLRAGLVLAGCAFAAGAALVAAQRGRRRAAAGGLLDFARLSRLQPLALGLLERFPLDIDPAHEGHAVDDDRGPAGLPVAAHPVVEAAHDADAVDPHVRVLGHGDLDAAHDRNRVDGHHGLREACLAQVDLAAAHDRHRGEVLRHHPVALAGKAAQDADGDAGGRLAAEPVRGTAGRGRRRGEMGRPRLRQVMRDRLEVGVGLGRVHGVKALVEFLHGQPTFGGGLAKDLRGMVAVGIRSAHVLPAARDCWGTIHG